jgi:hypothetical protein
MMMNGGNDPLVGKKKILSQILGARYIIFLIFKSHFFKNMIGNIPNTESWLLWTGPASFAPITKQR